MGEKKIEKERKIGAFLAKNVLFCYADVIEILKTSSCVASRVLFYAEKTKYGLILINVIDKIT